MAYELRDGQGSLFKAKPNDNPKWPGYEGSAMIDGKEYFVSAWVKEGAKGKFFSLAFKPKKGGRTAEPTARAERGQGYDPSEAPPF